jgi:DNA polymerase elongation subunit (family B)
MAGPTTDARIYLLEDADRRIVPGGPAVIGPGGVREDISPAAFRVVQHVLEAIRGGQAVKVVPLRTELPIDEAADAVAVARDVLRSMSRPGRSRSG